MKRYVTKSRKRKGGIGFYQCLFARTLPDIDPPALPCAANRLSSIIPKIKTPYIPNFFGVFSYRAVVSG